MPQPRNEHGLVPKRELFAVTYATTGDRKLALEKAGYSINQNWPQKVTRLLTNPAVQARIKAVQLEAASKATMLCAVSREWITRELQDNVARAKAAVPVLDPQGHETGEWRSDLPAANRALELLGKSVAMFTDKVLTEDLERSLDGKSEAQVMELVSALIVELGPGRIRELLSRHEGTDGGSERASEAPPGATPEEAAALQAICKAGGVSPGRFN